MSRFLLDEGWFADRGYESFCRVLMCMRIRIQSLNTEPPNRSPMEGMEDFWRIAEDTGLRKSSGFCEYPLWAFKQEFLEEIGGENYAEYSQCHDAYMKAVEERLSAEENFDPTEHAQGGMTMQ